jgi:hypothetical protein
MTPRPPSSSSLAVGLSASGTGSPAKPPRPPNPSLGSPPQSKLAAGQGSPSGGGGLITRVSSLTQWLGSGGVPPGPETVTPVSVVAPAPAPTPPTQPNQQQEQRSSPEAMQVDTPPPGPAPDAPPPPSGSPSERR